MSNMKKDITYRVIPLYGHNNDQALKAVMIIQDNTEFLNSIYPSKFYKDILDDCNTILNNGIVPEGIKGIPVTVAMEPFLLKKLPKNECFLAIHDLEKA